MALIIDAEFAALLEEAGEGRPCFIAWDEPGAGPRPPHARRPDPRRRRLGPPAGARAGQGDDPHVRHDRHAEGRAAASSPSRSTRSPRCSSGSRCGARSRTMIAAPLFHSWGFTHFTLAMGLGSTIVLRRRFDPEATLSLTAQHRCEALVVVPVMLQRILELDDEVLRALRPVGAQGRAGLRLRAARRAVEPLDGPVRRQPLQPLRLDGGGVGDDRDAGGPARRARHGRPPAARDGGEAVRRARTARSRPARPGRIFVGNELAVRGLHGRRQQGATSAGCCRPATSATSTPAGACSSTAATTT